MPKDIPPFVGIDYSQEPILWTDKKRPLFGKPISFTRYTLYSDRLLISSGLLTLRQDELRLYRILDVNMRQTIFQRIFGVGTVRISSADNMTPDLSLIDIKTPSVVMRLISDAAESERKRCNIGMMEGLSSFTSW